MSQHINQEGLGGYCQSQLLKPGPGDLSVSLSLTYQGHVLRGLELVPLSCGLFIQYNLQKLWSFGAYMFYVAVVQGTVTALCSGMVCGFVGFCCLMMLIVLPLSPSTAPPCSSVNTWSMWAIGRRETIFWCSVFLRKGLVVVTGHVLQLKCVYMTRICLFRKCQM